MGVAVAVAVAVGDIPVAVGVAVAVAVGLVAAVAVAVAVAVGVGLAPPALQKISIKAVGTPVLSYPPASQMRVVPSVSVGKLRRAVTNAGTGVFTVHMLVPGSYASTSFDGLGATLPPPITNILPLKVRPRVSPVALGIAVIEPIVLATGLKLNELVVSTTNPP